MSADVRPAVRSDRRVDQRLSRRGGARELLRLPAALFHAAATARGLLYDRGLLPVMQLDTPVVSVGNLSVGGTGKTPMVAWIARALRDQGRRPGLLSRGYGRGAQHEENDEARLLARMLPDVPHVQDPDRVAGGQRLEQLGVDAIVLDDGFQHRRLHRDLDLVLVDATRPWGLARPPEGGEPVRALLPRGLLREPPAALARADVIVVTRADCVEPAVLDALRAELGKWAPGLEPTLACHAPAGLVEQQGEQRTRRELSELSGLEVDLVSGIGNPEGFEATVRGLGGVVASHRVYPDHHAFTVGDAAATGPRPVLVTAKDAVKLEHTGESVLVLDVELVISEGEAALRERLAGLPEGRCARERRGIHAGLHG